MRSRSLKMQALYRERRRFVAAYLEANPVCQRCRMDCADDVHEIKSRARGGSILSEANVAGLCRSCHTFVTDHPRQAEAEGLAVHSWDASPVRDLSGGES